MKKKTILALFLALTCLTSLFAVNAQAADVPTPIAFYHFDDAANPGKDATGNGNDLAAKGNVTIDDSGKYGKCAYFDGQSVLAAVPDADKLEFIDKIDNGTKKLSMVFWYKITADDIIACTEPSQRFRVFSGGNTGLARHGGFTVVLRPDSLILPTVMYNDAQCDFPGEYGIQNIVGRNYEFVDDQWVHIGLTIDATTNTTTYYVNGEQVANTTTEKDKNFRFTNVEMWSSFGGNYMVNANGAEVFNQCYIGKIDEAGIFDTVLTADQVKYYMNNGCYGGEEPADESETTPAATESVPSVTETKEDTTKAENTTKADGTTVPAVTKAPDADQGGSHVLPIVIAVAAVVVIAVVVIAVLKKKK